MLWSNWQRCGQLLQQARCKSNLPPFDHASKFKVVNPPSPEWQLGGGLPKRMKDWSEEVNYAKRKTWDFTNSENIKSSYRLLTSAIIPRPVALVSTLSSDGYPNLAPFSYFSMVSHNPPMISLSFSLSTRRPKDTRTNILANKEFTVSIISEPFIEAANATSVESPADTDEWIISGLTKENSTLVKPPFVRESAISMECELYSFQDICLPSSAEPTTTVVLGLIRQIHVRESVLSDDGTTVDPAKLRPVARLGGTTYARLLEGFDLPRLSWRAIKDDYQSLDDTKLP
ncbi:hypothetical protein B0H34DRAFT_840101 [Crassisporium funariophilum]|nr:hypothetical protein B0H34DRAFT_840101 [Crassisporium funariophilum]